MHKTALFHQLRFHTEFERGMWEGWITKEAWVRGKVIINDSHLSSPVTYCRYQIYEGSVLALACYKAWYQLWHQQAAGDTTKWIPLYVQCLPQEDPDAALSGTQSSRQPFGELQKAPRGLHLTSLAAHLYYSEGILFQGMNSEGNVQQSVFPKLSWVTKRREIHLKMPEFIALLVRTVSQIERGTAMCKGWNWGRRCAGYWSGGRQPMGDALLLGSCMCCVAFLCCLLLTAGRKGHPSRV